MPFKFLLLACAGLLCLSLPAWGADVPLDHPDIVRWADGVATYNPGDELDATWQDPAVALGQASGEATDVTGLGRGGSIMLTFSAPLVRGEGWDFAVFENGFSETFLELAWVDVSSNGNTFVRFPGVSHTPAPVPAFGAVDPDDVSGFAGKAPLGYGTPMDLDDLAADPAVVAGEVDLDDVRFVRLVDVVGDGSVLDSEGRPVYDPYPTTGSAGFDLQGIAARSAERTDSAHTEPSGGGAATDDTSPSGDGSAGISGGCTIASSGSGWALPLLCIAAVLLLAFRCPRS